VKSEGGAGRCREGAQASRFVRNGRSPVSGQGLTTDAAGGWRSSASRKQGSQGRCLTVVTRGSIDRADRRIPGSRPRCRSSSQANTRSLALGSRRRRGAGSPCTAFGFAETGPTVVMEQALEGKKPRRAPTVGLKPWPGQGHDENGLSRGVRLRSGRAGLNTASPVGKGMAVAVDA